MKKILVVLSLVCAVIYSGFAANAAAPAATPTTVSGAPDILAIGFKSYLTAGYAAAIADWVKGSNLEVDAPAREAVNKVLAATENTSGTFVGPEIIRIVTLSPSSTLVYVFSKYQRGALYMCFACYETNKKWLVTSITVDSDPAKVLPPNVLGGQ